MKRRLLLLALWLVSGIGALVAIVFSLFQAIAGNDRSFRVSVSFDQSVNAAIGGSEDETISSRAGKGMLKGVKHWCVLCRFLDTLAKDHCLNNIEKDEGEKIAS